MQWESTASVIADSPPDAVWRVLADGPRWAEWNERVAWLWIETSLAPGNLVTIKPTSGRQTAYVIEDAVPQRRLVLRLTFGPVAALRLTWTLAPHDGGTRIDASIAITGIAARLLVKKMAERAAAVLPANLERLAARAAQ